MFVFVFVGFRVFYLKNPDKGYSLCGCFWLFVYIIILLNSHVVLELYTVRFKYLVVDGLKSHWQFQILSTCNSDLNVKYKAVPSVGAYVKIYLHYTVFFVEKITFKFDLLSSYIIIWTASKFTYSCIEAYNLHSPFLLSSLKRILVERWHNIVIVREPKVSASVAKINRF